MYITDSYRETHRRYHIHTDMVVVSTTANTTGDTAGGAAGQNPVAADIVFLVEATTNLEASFSDIKNHYISQILNHFNPAFNDDPDMAIDVSTTT